MSHQKQIISLALLDHSDNNNGGMFLFAYTYEEFKDQSTIMISCLVTVQPNGRFELFQANKIAPIANIFSCFRPSFILLQTTFQHITNVKPAASSSSILQVLQTEYFI